MSDYGLISVVPPLLAIFLAFKTKDTVVSLFTSIFVGVLIFAKGNLYVALVEIWQTFIFKQVSAPWNAELLVLITSIGVFIALIEESGSIESLAKKVSHFIGSRVRVQISAWITGLILFFSDSANCLILGPVFRPLADRFGVSREKLAYIVDSTASPVCMLVPISTWAILIGGIIEASLKDNGIEMDILTSYAKCLPYQYYTILAVFLVPLVALSRKDFGAMAVAERLAIEGKSRYLLKKEEEHVKVNNSKKESPAFIALVSILILLFVIIFMLLSFGFPGEVKSGNVRISLVTAYTIGSLGCMAMLVWKIIMTLPEAIECAIKGAKNMSYIIIIFIAALTLGNICSVLGTGKFLAHVTVPYIHSILVPALVFILGTVISFSTGTANGTQAILIPLAIPLAISSGAPLFVTIGAAAAGGLFGDHCSPISDTTILSSMGSGCEPLDHVRTQIPYTLIAALVATLAYVVSSFTEHNVIVIAGSFILMYLLFNLGYKLYPLCSKKCEAK
ncbi:SLC13 family permease [Cloacibacillus porcorum]